MQYLNLPLHRPAAPASLQMVHGEGSLEDAREAYDRLNTAARDMTDRFVALRETYVRCGHGRASSRLSDTRARLPG